MRLEIGDLSAVLVDGLESVCLSFLSFYLLHVHLVIGRCRCRCRGFHLRIPCTSLHFNSVKRGRVLSICQLVCVHPLFLRGTF